MSERDGKAVHLAAAIFYFGFRVLGASKQHAWDRAKLTACNAVIDKVVELTGIRHPDGIPDGHMQISFAGGPYDREVRTVEVCGTVDISKDGTVHRYRRTDNLRGQSTIFEYQGRRS